MRPGADVTDEALVAAALEVLVNEGPLTDAGKNYAKRWAAYVLRVDREIRRAGADSAGNCARPKCSFNMVLGRDLRRRTTAAVDAVRQGRDLKPLHEATRDVAVP
jgi:hypothetical protein